ncbi:hypothetical protein BVX98_07800, partial [bacterium F11]
LFPGLTNFNGDFVQALSSQEGVPIRDMNMIDLNRALGNSQETVRTHASEEARPLSDEGPVSHDYRNLDGTWNTQLMEVVNTYNAVGHLDSSVGNGSSLSGDGFGNITRSGEMSFDQTANQWVLDQAGIVQQFEIINNQAKMITSRSISDTRSKDRGTNHQELTVRNTYDDNGILTGVIGRGTFVSVDASRNVTRGTLTQRYDLNLLRLTGQAKVKESVSEGNTLNVDGSTGYQRTVVTTRYDRDGRIRDISEPDGDDSVFMGVHALGTSRTDDGYGNISVSKIEQRYDQELTLKFGSGKLATTINRGNTYNRDGSSAKTLSVQTNIYDADGNGKLVDAEGDVEVEANDGFGNITNTHTDQEFDEDLLVETGLLRQSRTLSYSHTNGVDGTESEQATPTQYAYRWDRGEADDPNDDAIIATIENGDFLVSETKGQSVTFSEDSYGNRTHSGPQDFFLTNQNELDKGWDQVNWDAINWNQDWDQTENTQTYIVVNNQFRVGVSETATHSINVDDTTSNQVMTVTNTYDEDGRLIGASGSGTGDSHEYYDFETVIREQAIEKGFDVDAILQDVELDEQGRIDNETKTETQQVFVILFGQARISEQNTVTTSTTWDRVDSNQSMSLGYDYDNHGRLTGATGNGFSATVDSFENVTNGTIEQELRAINGQARVVFNHSEVRNRNTDGSFGQQITNIRSSYHDDGRLKAVTGDGRTENNDGFGNITTATIQQIYKQSLIDLMGLQRIEKSINSAQTRNRDGSTTDQTSTTENTYNEKGRLVHVEGDVEFTSNDGFGNLSQGYTEQEYDSVLLRATGLVRMAQTSTYSKSSNLDRSETEQVTVTKFAYDERGHGKVAEGLWTEGITEGRSASLSRDGFGNQTWSGDFLGDGTVSIENFNESAWRRAESIQRYIIVNGQARVAQSINTTHTIDTVLQAKGIISLNHQTIIVNNQYNETTGRLLSVSGSGTFESTDGFGGVTDGNITQVYGIVNGQVDMLTSDTLTNTHNRLDNARSDQRIVVQNTYNEDGLLVA